MNRRNYQRVNIPLLASIEIEHDRRTIIASTSNASLNGLLLLAEETIANDEPITITIPLNDRDDNAVIQCVGTVVRHTDGAIGVHIATLGSNSFLQWRDLLYGQPHREAQLNHARQPAPL